MSTHNTHDRFLDREGTRLRWRMEGSGPPIALLHGWALDLEYWDALARLLAPRYTVLRFDRCGFGLSTGTPDIHRNVADLRALLEAAGINRVLLLGMSQGARLGIHFALDQPACTRALLLDGAPALEAESDLPVARYRSLLEKQGILALQAEILRHPLMQLQNTDSLVRQQLEGCVARYRGLDLLHPVRRSRTPGLGSIAAPALILNGSLDSPGRLDAGRQLLATIPGARRLELPGAGHLALLDDPAAYAQTVDGFIAALPP